MQCRRLLQVVLAVVVVLTLSQAQGPPIPPAAPLPQAPANQYPQVQSSHCRYLINAPSPWGTNASPFKLYTRSYSGEVRRGYPIEVSILPFYEAFKFFNFTDFALWAEPQFGAMRRPEPEMQFGSSPAPGGPVTVSHLGVWQVFPQYAGGAGSMKCNMYTRGEDTVGSFEERMLELLKTQFPFDARLLGFNPSARHGAAFLWYPDERTMRSTSAIKFVAKLKSFGQWFKLESTPWRVHRPPPRRQMNYKNMNNMMDQTLEIYQNLAQMERKLERAGTPGI